MVIGYGFRDEHINEANLKASNSNQLEMCIIDAVGANVLENTMFTFGANKIHSHNSKALRSIVVGASRRPIRKSLVSDEIEQKKIMRFFDYL